MSSNPAASSIDLAGSKVVREVLKSAGHRKSQSNASSDMKRDASPLLSAVSGRGARTKSALLDLSSAGNSRRYEQVPIPSQRVALVIVGKMSVDADGHLVSKQSS